MEYEGLPEIRAQAELWNQLELLRQNPLMGESQFISFVRDSGIPLFGVIEGEPGDFVRRTWLQCDDRDDEGAPRFHRFRLFPLHRLLERCDLKIARKTSLDPKSYLHLAERLLAEIPSDDEFQSLGKEWNRVVDLAVLLEPIYWPRVVERQESVLLSEEDIQKTRRAFRPMALDFVRTLDRQLWKRVHQCLCIDAARLDRNSHLYVLLRVANWRQREMLKGPISGALWLRHMAEVIRRGFEEVFEERWSEEYEVTGYWLTGARERIFGSEHPLDHAMRTKPFIAREFGLFTGSSVRWYVEGHTEYFAFLELLREPGYYGIELINLEGEIRKRKGNFAMKLEGMLQEDRRLLRFSMVSIDKDVEENRTFLSKQIREDNLVGGVALHKPDFEFANFSLAELVEIAATMDESLGFSGAPIRDGQCSATTAKTFALWYGSVSARPGGDLKGEAWGRALGCYASEHPLTIDGQERSMISQMRAAAFGWSTSYIFHYQHYALDPDTFASIQKSKTSE